MPRSKEISQAVKEKTGGLVSFLSDYLLLQILTGLEIMTSGYGSRNVYRASERAMEEFLGIKEDQIKAGISSLKNRGYISFAKPGARPEITNLGRGRLKRILPQYDKNRPWDGKIYVVAYDIPEKTRFKRDQLRSILQRLGCGKMQSSVWITPFNPKEVLKNFVWENRLSGLVIVSEVDKDGAIGGESFPELVYKVYNLSSLEKEYASFIKRHTETKALKDELAFEYLSLLKKDPQLPFELLPKNWLGREANKIYLKIIKTRL